MTNRVPSVCTVKLKRCGVSQAFMNRRENLISGGYFATNLVTVDDRNTIKRNVSLAGDMTLQRLQKHTE
jgi:hypothetical protein